MDKALRDAMASEKRAAVIVRRECLLTKLGKHERRECVVYSDKCIGCKKCLAVGCPAVQLKGGRSFIDRALCVGCTVCAQVCPVHAISRKEG